MTFPRTSIFIAHYVDRRREKRRKRLFCFVLLPLALAAISASVWTIYQAFHG